MQPRPDMLPATAVGLLALALRVPFLNRGFWRDEGETYYDVAPRHLADALAMIRHNEQGPPLYFLIERAWTSLFGFSEFAMHVPSLIFGTLAAIAMYALGRSVGNRLTGMVAGCITALAPLALDTGSEARPYALVLLLTAFALLAFVRCERTGDLKWAAALVLCGLALGSTHFTGTLVLGLLAFAAAIRALIVRTRAATAAAFASAMGFAGGLVWFPLLFGDLRRLPHYRSTAPVGTLGWFEDRLNYFAPFPKMRPQFDWLVEIGAAIAIAATMIKRRFDERDWHLVLFAFLAIAGVAIESLSAISPERHLVAFALPAWAAMAMLAERFVAWVRSPSTTRARFGRAAATLAVLWIAGGGLLTYPSGYAPLTQPLSGTRDLVQALDDVPARPLIVVAPDWMGWTLGYYYLRAHPRAEIHGLGTWRHAELYNPDASAWFDPRLVPKAVERIEREARTGRRSIVLVINPRVRNSGGIPYTKSLDLKRSLERRWGVALDRMFESPREPAELIVFTATEPLRPRGDPRARLPGPVRRRAD